MRRHEYKPEPEDFLPHVGSRYSGTDNLHYKYTFPLFEIHCSKRSSPDFDPPDETSLTDSSSCHKRLHHRCHPNAIRPPDISIAPLWRSGFPTSEEHTSDLQSRFDIV